MRIERPDSDEWEDSPLLRERRKVLRRVRDMKLAADFGQYEAGWNDALERVAQWIEERGI